MGENSEIRLPRPNVQGGISREIARWISPMLDFTGNFPGSRLRQPSSMGISREISKFPGNPPGGFPGFGISREIPREVGCGIRTPGKFTGKSVSPDCVIAPWKLIAIKRLNREFRPGAAVLSAPSPGADLTRGHSGFPAGRRRRFGAQRAPGPPVPEFRGLRPSLFRN